MRPSFRFPRSHRLKRRRLIQALFNRNDESVGSLVAGGIRIQYRCVSPTDMGVEVPLQVGFAVGKSTGGAVVRNRVKRILREVYRMNQRVLVDLFSERPDVLTMMIVYRGNPADEEALRADLAGALSRLAGRFKSDSPTPPT
ncbi:MAG: ribonuclease P protein component [Bacteroidetes bacterium]|nr:ribonuclease P protein component [Bacteroidota bacterium]